MQYIQTVHSYKHETINVSDLIATLHVNEIEEVPSYLVRLHDSLDTLNRWNPRFQLDVLEVQITHPAEFHKPRLFTYEYQHTLGKVEIVIYYTDTGNLLYVENLWQRGVVDDIVTTTLFYNGTRGKFKELQYVIGFVKEWFKYPNRVYKTGGPSDMLPWESKIDYVERTGKEEWVRSNILHYLSNQNNLSRTDDYLFETAFIEYPEMKNELDSLIRKLMDFRRV